MTQRELWPELWPEDAEQLPLFVQDDDGELRIRTAPAEMRASVDGSAFVDAKAEVEQCEHNRCSRLLVQPDLVSLVEAGEFRAAAARICTECLPTDGSESCQFCDGWDEEEDETAGRS